MNYSIAAFLFCVAVAHTFLPFRWNSAVAKRNSNGLSTVDSCLVSIVLFTAVYENPLRILGATTVKSYWDEIAVALVIMRLLFLLSIRKLSFSVRITFYLVTFLIVGFISSWLSPYTTPYESTIAQAYLWVKIWIAFIYFYHLVQVSTGFFTLFLKFLKVAVYVASLSVLAQFILVSTQNLFQYSQLSSLRYGFSPFTGFFSHPTSLAALSGISCILFLALKSKNIFISRLDIAIALLLTIGTLRRRAIIALLLAIIYIKIKQNFSKSLNRGLSFGFFLLPLLIVISPVLIFVIQELINSYIVFGLEQARTNLYITSYDIGKEYFPIGIGFATFGTTLGFNAYSQVFSEYGLTNIWGLSPTFDAFASDTFWPSLLAETGFIGLFIYLQLLLFIYFQSKKLLKQPESQAYGIAVTATFVFCLIDSIAAPTFLAPPLGYLFTFVCALSVSKEWTHQKKNRV